LVIACKQTGAQNLLSMNQTLLSVSGNKAINYLLKTTLSDNYTFISTDNIYSAVSELKMNDNVALVIADIDSPESEDFTFIHHVKTSSLYQVPVIILTGNQNKDMSRKITNAGADGLFYKPFNPAELVRMIHQTLHKKLEDKPLTISSL
jgi:DNA-binding NtrC family response regulator